MTLRTAYNEEHDQYELLDDVEGVSIVFASVPGGDVRSRIANQQAQGEQQQAEGEQTSEGDGGLVPNSAAAQ